LESDLAAPKDTESPLDILGRSELFGGLPKADLGEIATSFRPHWYPPQSMLFCEGQPALTYHLVSHGKIKITQVSAEGEEVILHVAQSGQVIGALPTLGEGTYPASAQALDESLTLAASAEAFEAIMREYPAVARRMLLFATRQLQVAHRRLREMATDRVERRIARTLTRLASQLGRKQGTSIEIEAPLSRQDLAELSGTTIYTVSRTLKAWQRQGLLRAYRKKLVILDPHGLVTVAEDLPARPRSE
jgi:CRP-like cAMP-binding protein